MRFATCDVKAERSYKELGFAVSEATKRSYQTISVILDEQKKESQPLFLIWRLINMYIVIGNQQSRIAIFFRASRGAAGYFSTLEGQSRILRIILFFDIRRQNACVNRTCVREFVHHFVWTWDHNL